MGKFKFILLDQSKKFTQRQKELIEFHIIKESNWRTLAKYVTNIELKEVGNNYIIISGEEVSNKRHSLFSIKLCKHAGLHQYIIDQSTKRLFKFEYL